MKFNTKPLRQNRRGFFIMDITVKRPAITDQSFTISELWIDDVFFSHVIEDRDRGLHQQDTLQYIQSIKVKHETAIPYGSYQVVMSFSQRFQKFLPELLDVPGFSGIRIHAGNTEADSSGCLLPGIQSGNKVINSRTTTSKLIGEINKRVKKEKVFIHIVPNS